MNSRERIRLATEHKEADRVPIDIGSMRSTGISATAYNRLTRKLGLDVPCLMYDFQQQLAYTGTELRDRFHVDSIDVGQAFIGDLARDWREWSLDDGSVCLIPAYLDVRRDSAGTVTLHSRAGTRVGAKPANSVYIEQCSWPYGSLPSIPEELDERDMAENFWSVPCLPFNLDIINSRQDYEAFVRGIRQLHEQTEYATMISIGHSFFEFGQFIRRTDNFLMDISLDRKGVERLLDKLLDGYLAKLEYILKDVAQYIDVAQFGDDLGTQRGPWMRPSVIRELFVPRYRILWDYVHRHSNCKVFMHSCGSIYKVLPDLIDAGLDIINPVQTSAADMEPTRLKREFGRALTFWGGGCDTQGVLKDGTPQQVRDDVKQRIEIFARDGGFVFNQIHNVLAEVPPENVIAMYDAAYEFGKY